MVSILPSGLNYGCIFLVPSNLILLPMGSSLTDGSSMLLVLMNSGHQEYHKEYCRSNTFSFAYKRLWSLGLQHFLCWSARGISIATDSQTACEQTELLFFLSTHFGLNVLSQKIYEWPDTEIPIILSLHLMHLRAYMPCFMATNSGPKTNVSTMHCFLENCCTRAMLAYIKKALLDLQDIFSPAWSLSTNI